eukprot:scaffold8.g1590.t1
MASKLKLDSLFSLWLSMPESHKLVAQLLEDVKAGRPITASSPSKKHGMPTHFASTPQPSPAIPQFYFPAPAGGSVLGRQVQQQVNAFLSAHLGGVTLEQLKVLLKQVLLLPSSLAYPLFYKLASATDATVSAEALLAWMHTSDFWAAPDTLRAFKILCQARAGRSQEIYCCTKRMAPDAVDLLTFFALPPASRDSSSTVQEGANYVFEQDVRPVLAGILVSHPGLEFLQDAPEFQDRYAETVIHRIFYSLDRSCSGRLTHRELRRGDLLQVLHQVDEEEDINKVLRYFSYEHFYVIYCKFWDLDTDHDFFISRDDLLRYGNHSLTFRITDRIFAEHVRSERMSYKDFVWFILSEEDKTTDASLQYWFRCCDLDGNGQLIASELTYFYEEQLHRMECLSQESVSFDDVMSQLRDMLEPEDAAAFTLRDLKRCRLLAGTLFNIMFNLNKFIAFETRDPFVMRHEREDGGSDWDRFARAEYIRLAVEEEASEDL